MRANKLYRAGYNPSMQEPAARSSFAPRAIADLPDGVVVFDDDCATNAVIVGDWIYDRIARTRYALFGRADSCFAPTAEQAARFLDQRSKP